MNPADDHHEAEMRAAIDSDDRERIDAAALKVDAHEQATTSVPLIAAALWFAEHGYPVFPLQPGSKVPMRGSRGCKDATIDAEKIRAWWDATPEANIGLATGHLVDVVDIDGPAGQKSRAELWESTFERIDAEAVAKVLTPRAGGMHVYVPATGDGNSAGIAPGIDYRGTGGYVVAPPSRTDVGTYRFLGDATALTVLAGKATA